MTNGLLSMIRHKHELSMKVRKHPSNSKLLSHYIKYKNSLTMAIRSEKTN